ncbi:hypothetical protein EVAR_44258_1 [Eumeta japonica]|uniref:Uncharacterized protein n=1 Tax=Eumeta variegata TaxID=151549 RepID=A0A4C1X8C2_EUMVA|nr:hypothetical protein EVAR_44258_1 [Eumeta japonica]
MSNIWHNAQLCTTSPTSPVTNYSWPDSGEDRTYLLLNDQPHARAGPPLPSRTKFWEDVYEDYYKYIRDGGKLQPQIVP